MKPLQILNRPLLRLLWFAQNRIRKRTSVNKHIFPLSQKLRPLPTIIPYFITE